MWRSLVAVRASLFRASRSVIRCSDVPLSGSAAQLQPSVVVPGSCFFRNPRYFSQRYSSSFDSEPSIEDLNSISVVSVNFGEGGDAQLESCVGNEEVHEFDGESVGADVGNSDLLGENVVVSDGIREEVESYGVNVEQLESVLSLLQSTLDGSFESSLEEMRLTLHEDFVLKVIETPHILGENLIRFFRWAVNSHPEFEVSTPVVDVLVRVVCADLRQRAAYSLWELIKEIGGQQNSLLNAEILNQLIAFFSKLGKGKAALEVLDSFEVLGCVPNAESYYFTVEALCRRSSYDLAWPVCEKMLDSGSLPESNRVGKIISLFCRGNKAKNAHSVYLLAKEKHLNLPQCSMNILIYSLCRDDETVKLALEMLNDFSTGERKRAIKPYMAVIRSLCRIKDTSKAKTLLQKMIAEGPPPGNAAFNDVISGYSKAGDLGEAMELIKLMESRGLKPDVYSYTVVISGYANGGQMKEAYEVLDEAKKKHAKLCRVTYHTLIRSHCKLEEYDSALKLLSEMKDFGLQPNADEYNKLIQSLCLKALDWRTSERLFEEMKENGLHLNGHTKGLIRAVRELEEEELTTEELSIAT
ncbi:pentatricopeptide repeat-containing protein At3g02650, mitochondrial [Cucumis melo]|uniref:Pentatricopeptide repeat-containing protein At3g02650, mitochondrial n=1 Tax=Cucumis melo TaxID=3656 RepID=A0ABM3KUG5_CUCME|nr:pentatricopeptide repeat-containing protein At3g02650, mitochondrial [Cucumis melo]